MDAKVIIVGGGIIGCATAYYLSQKGHNRITIIEREHVACHASGKAGGFLARNWGNSKTKHLHQLSFDLIKNLAEKHPAHLQSYRQITTLNVTQSGGKMRKNSKSNSNTAPWIANETFASTLMDDITAQITPKELTTFFSTSADVSIIHATVIGLKFLGNCVVGVKVRREGEEKEEEIEGEKVVITMGAWSGVLEGWLQSLHLPFRLPMKGIRSSSMIYCNDNNNNNDNDNDDDNGEDEKRGTRMITHDSPFVLFCEEDRNDCHLEGKINNVENLYVNCGHNCWGILWSAGSGLLMAELLLSQPTSIDISPFNPNRFS